MPWGGDPGYRRRRELGETLGARHTHVETALVKDDQRHAAVDEPGGVRDVNGRLLLVARQHPQVDVGLQ